MVRSGYWANARDHLVTGDTPAASSAAWRSGARGEEARERGRASGEGEEVEELTAEP